VTHLRRRAAIFAMLCLSAAPQIAAPLPAPGADPPSATGTPEPPAAMPPMDPPVEAHPYGWRQVGIDARTLWTRPFHLERNGVIKMALTAGTVGVLYLYREEIRRWVQERSDPGKSEFLDKVSVMGDEAFAPSLALLAYGASFATRNPREKETAVLLLESAGHTALLTGIGQSVLSTQRPFDGEEIEYFSRRGHGVSGHASVAACIVPILSRQYLVVDPGDSGSERFWKVGAAGFLYAGAFLTGYERLDSDEHWAPEVFLGLVTGFSVGQILSDSHEASRREQRVRFSVGAGSFQARVTF
jgi:membrane-associated phospholipid phosphatase